MSPANAGMTFYGIGGTDPSMYYTIDLQDWNGGVSGARRGRRPLADGGRRCWARRGLREHRGTGDVRPQHRRLCAENESVFYLNGENSLWYYLVTSKPANLGGLSPQPRRGRTRQRRSRTI